MPEKMKHHHNKRGGNNSYYNRGQNFDANGAPQNQQFQQPQPSMIQINNLAELAALSGFGGFNPNKYMAAPMPMGYQGQNYNYPLHMVYQQQMYQG